MSLSIKVSQLGVLTQITSDDYIIVNDSGSVTTKRSTFSTLQDFLSGSTVYVGSASFALTASYSKSSSYSSYSLSSSYSISASNASASISSSHAFNSVSSSYSNFSLNSRYSTTSSFSTSSISASYSHNSTSASYSHNSTSASYSFSSSYSRNALSSSYALSSSKSDESHVVWINGGSVFTGNGTDFRNPFYQYMVTWSGSYTGKLQKSNLVDLGIQYNVGKPFVFQITDESDYPDDLSKGHTPILQPYIELRQGTGVYNQWLILSYIYTGGTGNDATGSFVGYQNPATMPPGTYGVDRNLRYIPKGEIENNQRDETGIGSQTWTEYFRSQRNWAWYYGGSFFGHSDLELDPGISSSVSMVLSGNRLGIGNFHSHSIDANPAQFFYPQACLHISASENALNDTDVSLVRLDQAVGSAGSIGSLQGWIRININGTGYKIPIYS